MARDGLDAVIACGTEYTGFDGGVIYLSGFAIVHRYAYVLLPLEGDPAIVFPREATYVGEHGTTWIDEQVFVDRPGEWLADRVRGKRVGVFGLDYVMPVRDFTALDAAAELVSWDVAFDHARAVKSDFELDSVRESVRINVEGFWTFVEEFAPGRTEREVLAPCEELFVAQRLRPQDDGHGARGRERLRAAGVQGRGRAAVRRDRHGAAVARGRRRRRPLGRGLARDLPGRAERRVAADDGGLRRVLRRGAHRAARRRDRARRPHRRLQGLPRPRLRARPRHRPLDRDDDARVPEDRRRRRDRAALGHGLLDAPARDHDRRPARASTCRTRGS